MRNDRFLFRIFNKETNEYMHPRYVEETSCFLLARASAKYIVEQCTGLKDKNGELIYEGDIIKAFLPYGKETNTVKFPVCYKNGAFGNNFLNVFGPLANFSSKVEYEVLGNIHESPNLADEGYYYL